MRQEGFSPAVVVETSPSNFQAWLNHGRILPKDESTVAARALAERFRADKGAADWRHFGRLAGLTNRKAKYCGPDGLFPFVKLESAAPGLVYANRDEFLAQIRTELERRRPTAPRPVSVHSTDPISRGRVTIEDFRSRPEYGGDGNRIDLAYAVCALSHAVPEADVRAAIASRDLSKKGNDARQADYIARTIRKARAAVREYRVDPADFSKIASGRSR
jgi:hypothetical protein